MSEKFKGLIISIFLTVLLLLFLEILSTSLFSIIGLAKFKPSFHIIIVIFLSFYFRNAYLAVLILLMQYIHSLFSIEGWAMGTFAGVIVSMLISYIRELINLSSPIITVIVTQVSMIVWFFITSILLYLQMDELNYVLEKFWRFLPESIVLSLLSPILFVLLETLWRKQVVDEGSGSLG